MGKVRLSIFYHGLLRPPLTMIILSFTVQAIANASCMPAQRAPLINGCGHTSGTKRGEKSKFLLGTRLSYTMCCFLDNFFFFFFFFSLLSVSLVLEKKK